MRFRLLNILGIMLLLCLIPFAAAMAEGSNAPSGEIAGFISGDKVNLRAESAATSPVKAVLAKGTTFTILEVRDLWLKVRLANLTEGWVYREYVKTGNDTAFRNRVEAVISYARRLIGSRYRYGGISAQGFDCSGFTRFVMAQFSLDLPHNAAAQFQCGTPLAKNDLEPGDLVFFSTLGAKFINHVGIYIGGGEFVHASSGSGRVRISPLDEGYYLNCYRGARRVIDPGKWAHDAQPEVSSDN